MIQKFIYRVSFHGDSSYAGQDYYFTSLAAIYERFNASDVGLELKSLWAARATRRTYANRYVAITRYPLYGKPRR